MEKLEGLYGIGPVFAKKIVKEGINGVKINLKKSIRRQLKNPKVFPHLPMATQADLKYNPSRKIPRKIIGDINKSLHKRLKGIRHQIAGSFRRCKPYSRDIDLIISGKKNTPEKIIKKINHNNRKFQIVHIYAQGSDKISAIMSYKSAISNNKKINIKVDIFFTEPREFMFMLLFATGSGQFNIRMRVQAKRKGYLLNQHGLYKRTAPDSDVLKMIPVKNEAQLFKLLGMKYLTPPQRKT